MGFLWNKPVGISPGIWNAQNCMPHVGMSTINDVGMPRSVFGYQEPLTRLLVTARVTCSVNIWTSYRKLSISEEILEKSTYFLRRIFRLRMGAPTVAFSNVSAISRWYEKTRNLKTFSSMKKVAKCEGVWKIFGRKFSSRKIWKISENMRSDSLKIRKFFEIGIFRKCEFSKFSFFAKIGQIFFISLHTLLLFHRRKCF